MKILRAFLFCLLLLSFAFAQDFQHIPKNPQEIVKFRAEFGFQDDTVIKHQLFDKDQKLLIIGKRLARVWDVKAVKLLSETSHNIEKIDNFSYLSEISPDGKKLILFDYDDFRVSAIFFPKLAGKNKRVAAVYDLTTGKQISVLSGGLMSIRYGKWSENGKTIVTTNGWFSDDKESEICFWDGDTFAKRDCALIIGQLSWNYLSKDGKKFFITVQNSTSGAINGWVDVWDTENVRILERFDLKSIWFYDFTNIGSHFSRNGNYFAIQDINSVEVVEVENFFRRKAKVYLPRKSNRINFGSFSPDEKYFAVKNGKNGTEIYETETGELKLSIPQNKDIPKIWANEGKVLISYNCGKSKGYGVETGNLLYEIKLVCKERYGITQFDTVDEDYLLLHPNTGYFLTKSGTAVRIWNSATGELLQTVVNPTREAEKQKNPKSDDKIKGRSSVWSKDGKFLYVFDNDAKSVLQYEFVGD